MGHVVVRPAFVCLELLGGAQSEHVGDVHGEHVEPGIPGARRVVHAHGDGVVAVGNASDAVVVGVSVAARLRA